MNLKEFDDVATLPIPTYRLLAQDFSEWKFFLEFVEGYFKNRNILNPIVVEIGLMHNAQKFFYKTLLNAEHIGIDINMNCSPDILGNSHEIGTMNSLKSKLKGRQINLLFIDGNHSYENVKRDYDLFSPLTKHLIAFHDISANINSDVMRFWRKISVNSAYLSITFNKYNSTVNPKENKFTDMGIGILIRE